MAADGTATGTVGKCAVCSRLRCHHSGFTLDTGHFLRAYFALVSGQSLEVYDDSCSNRRLWFPHLAEYRAGIYAQPERRLFSIDAYQYASYGY